MWVVYVIIIMFILVLVKCCYDSVYGGSNDSYTKDDLEENIKYCEDALNKVNSKIDKPRISPPVHSMLELMMKDPDGFSNMCTTILGRDIWEHDTSYTRLIIDSNIVDNDKKNYYINECLITKEEGEYLLQGVDYIEAYIETKRKVKNKKRRHEIDRKIRKVLKENNL